MQDVTSKKLLIVEDNWLLAETLKKHLRTKFIIDVASTGEEALDKARNIQYRLIMLDLGLPDMNGAVVCSELRKSGVKTPILILTGEKQTSSIVRLLENGADDYLTKPFNSEELKARVTALLRRTQFSEPQKNLVVKDLVIDVGRRRVTRAGTEISLRRKEFDILEYLVSNHGRAVSRSMIFNHVWESGKEGWNNTVDVHINHLRQKVDRPFKTPLIKTAYGIGYMVDGNS
jgi:DNA-binding response OmpR family regulator